MCPDIVRVDLDRRIVVLQRGVEIALQHVDVGAIVDRVHVLRLLLDQAVAVGEGLVELAHHAVGDAAVAGDLLRGRFDLLGLREIGDRAVKILHQRAHAGAVGVAEQEFWRVFDRQVEIVERALQRTPAQLDDAAVVVGDTVGRALLEREVVVRHRMVVLARPLIGEAAQIERDDVVGIEVDGHGQGLDRVDVVALVDQRIAAHGERDGLVLAGEPVGVEQIVAGLRPRLRIRLAVAANGEVVAGLRIGRRDRAPAGQDGEHGDEGQGCDAQHVVRSAPATIL